jgi:hypothetical protein
MMISDSIQLTSNDIISFFVMDATFVSDQMQRQRRERHSTTEYSAIFVA